MVKVKDYIILYKLTSNQSRKPSSCTLNYVVTMQCKSYSEHPDCDESSRISNNNFHLITITHSWYSNETNYEHINETPSIME